MNKQSLAEALRVRPNTGLCEHMFHPSGNAVICCGEDPDEMQRIIDEVFSYRTLYARHRGYHAWKLEHFTLFLGGIGTGCVEPLISEILDHKNLGDRTPQRLVMIGTAGHIGDGVDLGQVYIVEAAYPVGCGVVLEEKDLPLRPNFAGLYRLMDLQRKVGISTDYYYGCTPADDDPRLVRAKALDPNLRKGIVAHWRPGRLIDMETAQFYHLAEVYGDSGKTQYVALRGVSNQADCPETQAMYSQQVLTAALRHAVTLLASGD